MESNHPHYVWAFVAIAGIGIAAWIYASNRPDQSNYGKDSTHNEQQRQDWPLSIHIGEGSCATFGAEKTLKALTNRTKS